MDAKLRVTKSHPSIINELVETEEIPQAEGMDTIFQLKTWPALVEDGGDLVVSWEGEAATPLTKKDFVTLSCGPTLSENDYFRKSGVNDRGSTDTSVRFSELYMMRCNYTAVYFNYRSSSGSYKAIGRVEAGMKEPWDTPKHGHISLTDDETGMAVMFNSASTKTPIVRYGENSEDLSLETTGTSKTYNASDMCHAPATTIGQQSFRGPGYMHTVVLTGLKPVTYYFYHYARSDGSIWDHFFHLIEPYATRVPYMIGIGNRGFHFP
ncbi:hypothetical protein BBJ29_004765 [Phytophthora kernoviae]|uniref:Purple acid phosphatase N-terminal domain-containing protein n=1 Tax=Phytophthora kernoviae TaxID=325452 RepID=A0A3F2RID2_9STRA|nr:hypothetical protein BBP00_00007344 [Phytophthora kernoviae]RLN70895.1 hypothetical protein BBJ29_004765 [Phytophthora kernoviae]